MHLRRQKGRLFNFWSHFVSWLRAFQAQRNHFPGALHEGIKIFGLGVTTGESGNGGDVVAFFVPFIHDRQFALGLHELILALDSCQGALVFAEAVLPLASGCDWLTFLLQTSVLFTEGA